ncbi:MAG: c-type cytochrome, partial [Gammaproteobacteria bacterium]
ARARKPDRTWSGGRQPYQDSCGFCHGPKARGNAVTRVPRLAGQHDPYVARQIRWIGRRPAAQYPA